MILDIIKVFAPVTVSFFIGMALTPILTHYLYKHKMWKKKVKSVAIDGRATPVFTKLHAGKEVGTPRMGGIIVWASAIATILLFWILAMAFPNDLLFEKMNFLSRGQTWLPLFTFFIGALVGLLDDYFEINENSDYFAGGLSLKKRLFIVLILSLIGGYWFFFKLGVSTIAIPFFGELALGSFFIPFFALVMLFIYSGGIIDGIDGLSGGVFATIFSAYGLIAFLQNQIDLAALSFVVVGSLLAFLWFNIPPARFYMSETGTMALTLLLTVVAFLTKQVGVLPIIAFPLVATTLSAIINVTSKKFRGGKKVFLSTPIHHHFEAIGWPGYKVAMRYWVISVVAAIIGLIIALIG
ncbi:MAG TPA: hypothetical protein QGH03_00985 [Candidatus Paceibacterota bacterium]|jgi:phospho-N-acetylmuramoyl-pentapeptide-transferase|nr:hypothetical protein [Parcubacteria group bacterium]HJN62793.1 hypothetical protein [Candidatus Paceibacterota bacterium]|tara:strand:- start:13414 stop:14472 length:1059 start_codon:yes stop_codon:yes gene_type:complete